MGPRAALDGRGKSRCHWYSLTAQPVLTELSKRGQQPTYLISGQLTQELISKFTAGLLRDSSEVSDFVKVVRRSYTWVRSSVEKFPA